MGKNEKQPKLYELKDGAEALDVVGTMRDRKTKEITEVSSVMVKRSDGLWQNAFWRSPKGAKTPYAFVEHIPQATQKSNG